MSEYAAVSSSSYDIDSLVAKLNERAAAGWDVVSVVSTGGEVSAILRRDSGGGAPTEAAAPAAEAHVEAPVVETPVVEAPVVEAPVIEAPVIETPEPVQAWTPEPEPAMAPVAEAATIIAPVQEPAGWGVADNMPTVAATPEPTPVSPIEVSAPQAAAPVNPAPVVTTPAGWYPDPSGRFEMRYWDGTAWTEHVSRQGQQFTDPPVA